jgi:uncharacterized Zn finger protein (UPF0148 family)
MDSDWKKVDINDLKKKLKEDESYYSKKSVSQIGSKNEMDAYLGQGYTNTSDACDNCQQPLLVKTDSDTERETSGSYICTNCNLLYHFTYQNTDS